MSKRYIQKYADLGGAIIWNHHKTDDLSTSEALELISKANEAEPDALIHAITTAYYMGYAVGHRRGSGREVYKITTAGDIMAEIRSGKIKVEDLLTASQGK